MRRQTGRVSGKITLFWEGGSGTKFRILMGQNDHFMLNKSAQLKIGYGVVVSGKIALFWEGVSEAGLENCRG